MDTTDPKKTYMSVLDLPQLYTRPPAVALLSKLNHLQLEPAAWDDGDRSPAGTFDEARLPAYLTSIIASPLAWIADDSVKEQIWEAASTRLSERSGRSAIPSVSRTFAIPATAFAESVSITLHEPSLTADNLGHKTWLASFLLAKRLPDLLPHLPSLRYHDKRESNDRVIELGAGTGLVGLAVAALFDVDVHLTDLRDIVPNLQSNVDTYRADATVNKKRCVSVGELDWSKTLGSDDGPKATYDLVVAADPLYSPEHPAWLVTTIGHVLRKHETARVVVELPLRDAYAPDVEDFTKRMSVLGLVIEAEGLEKGFDDWQSAHQMHARTEVECWWAVWRWALDSKSSPFQTATMVFGLLTLAALPTTIGVAEAISSGKKNEGDEEEDPTVASTTEAQRMRKFRLQCYCDAPSSKAKEINGGSVILRDDRVRPSTSFFSAHPVS
ncbi:MAG: hypothetical protein Q9173_007196 [Seirophora scorigena]